MTPISTHNTLSTGNFLKSMDDMMLCILWAVILADMQSESDAYLCVELIAFLSQLYSRLCSY